MVSKLLLTGNKYIFNNSTYMYSYNVCSWLEYLFKIQLRWTCYEYFASVNSFSCCLYLIAGVIDASTAPAGNKKIKLRVKESKIVGKSSILKIKRFITNREHSRTERNVTKNF
jgi:hypothetical protein